MKEYTDGLEEIKKQGGKVLIGGEVVAGPGNYVQATIVEIDPSAPIVKTELFVPILYVMKFKVHSFFAAAAAAVAVRNCSRWPTLVRRRSRRLWP